MFKKIYTATLTIAKIVIPAKAGIQRNTGFRVKPGMTERIGFISSCMKIDLTAVTFGLHRLLLAVTIWSCHAWVAPTYRLCHVLAAATFGLHRLLLAVTIWSCHFLIAPSFRLCHVLAAATFGLRSLRIDRNRIAATILQVEATGCEADKVLTPHIVRSSPCKAKTLEARIHYCKVFELRSAVTLIESIPRIWSHGVTGTRVQEKIIKNKPSDPRTLEPLNPSGFTLIELIVVMIITGILAATVIPRIDFTTSSTASADGAIYMIASDIRYAQEFAMANRISKSIQFSTVLPANKYTFNPVSAGMDPSGQLSGATIGTTVTFTFNSLGEPTTTAGWTVTVPGSTKTITVSNYTGKVTIS